MNSTANRISGRPGDLGAIDVLVFAAVAVGLTLASLGYQQFLILAGAGAFGPGILRQFGLLKSRDEFQRQASIVAGYRAYLVGGVYAMILLLILPWADLGSVVEAGKSATDTILFIMLITYVVSYLFHFWGARKAAYRILLVAGVGMAGYVLALCFLYDFPWSQMLVGFLTWSAPPILLALLSRRFPRGSGLILIVLSVGGLAFLQTRQFGIPTMAWIYRLLFVAPLVASGIGLLSAHRETADAEPE